MRTKRSPIWKMEENEFRAVIANAKSVGEALMCFGLKNIGGNFQTLKSRMESMEMSYFELSQKGKQFSKDRLIPNFAPPLESVLIENSTYNRCSLKKRLIALKILPNKCNADGCLVETMWNGQKLALHLDHKNGVRNDNRIENLWLLCPNCHSQRETSGGKRFKVPKPADINPLWRQMPRIKNRKVIDRPSKDKLQNLKSNMSMEAIGKKYGVSSNAVRKWIKTS